jgi:hypothetical protein
LHGDLMCTLLASGTAGCGDAGPHTDDQR